MITKDYLNDFNSPIRNITGKTELYKSSVSTLSGNYLSLGMVAPPGEKLTVKAASKNILPYPYYHTSYSRTGITWTDNGDGSISAKGTPTAAYSAGFALSKDTSLLEDGVEYTLSFGFPVGDATCFILYADENGKDIYSRNVVWSDKYTFKTI